MTRHEKTVLGVTLVGHLICHFSVLLVAGMLTTLQRDFDLTAFWVTFLPVCGYVLMGVAAIPVGLATDRWGAKKLLLIYFYLMAASCAAAATARTDIGLGVALTLLGAAASIYHPAGITLITHEIKKPGEGFGIHGIAGSLGLTGSAFGLWMASNWSWRAAYAIVGALAIVAGLVLLWIPIGGRRAAPTPSVQSIGNGRPNYWKVFLLLGPLYAAMMLSGFNYRLMMTSLPTYLTADGLGHYSGKGAEIAILIVFTGGALGQYAAGRYADRLKRPMRLYSSLVVVTVPMSLWLAYSGGVGAIAVLAAVGLAIFHFGGQPVENLMIAQYSHPSNRGAAYGLKFLAVFAVGAPGAPAVGAIWNDTGSLSGAYVVFALVAGVIACILLLGAKRLATVELIERTEPSAAEPRALAGVAADATS
jgi:MFS family permease